MANYYVDNSGADGDGSFGNPWNNINGHVGDLVPSDIMFLRGNAVRASAQVYSEDIDISFANGCESGTGANRITITTYNSEYVILRSATNPEDIIHINGIDYWTIDGTNDTYCIDFDKQSRLRRAINLDNADYITVRYCEMRDGAYYGIEVDDGSDYLAVRYCKIHNFNAGPENDAHGIYVRGGANGVVDGCNIYDCRGDCLQVEPDVGESCNNWEIENCELWISPAIASCAENALDFKGGSGHSVHDNEAHGFRYADGSCGGTGSGWASPAIMIHQAATGITVRDNEIYDVVSGIGIQAGSHTVKRNTIRDLAANAGGGPSAAFFVALGGNAEIYNNTVHNAPDYSVHFSDSAVVIIKNNLFNDCGDVFQGGLTTVDDDYNGWYDCVQTLGGVHDTTGTDPQPMFVDEANDDYRLQFGSTAIDTGTNVGEGFFGSAPDLGRYEYQGVGDVVVIVVTVVVVM